MNDSDYIGCKKLWSAYKILGSGSIVYSIVGSNHNIDVITTVLVLISILQISMYVQKQIKNLVHNVATY